MIHWTLPLIVLFLPVVAGGEHHSAEPSADSAGVLESPDLPELRDAPFQPAVLYLTINFNKNTSEISLKVFHDIAIIDSPKGKLSCKWGNVSCYVECANVNVSGNCTANKSLTLTLTLTLTEDEISAYNGSDAFNITAGSLDCEITKCLVDPFRALLNRAQHQKLPGAKNLKRVLNMKNMCSNLFDRAEVKRAYIGTERALIRLLLETPYEGEEIVYNLTDIAVKVTKANLSRPNPTEGYITIDAPLLSYEHLNCTPQTQIPTKIFQSTSEEKRKVAVVAYHTSKQFLFGTESPWTMLIRVELLEEERAAKLEEPLRMRFPVFNTSIDPEVHAFECQFYDESGGEHSTWSKRGCSTTVDEGGVLCACDHMTPFAVLLVPAENIDWRTWQILSIISYVGSALSAFFSAVSVLTYVFIRNPSQDYSASIHVSLSGALLLLNGSFLLNESLARTNVMPLCLLVGLLMHYGLLCSFTWMAIEALHLYLLIVRVFNTYVRSYVAKLSVIGWGVPALVIGISFGFKSHPNELYGLKSITLGNSTSSLCWITEEWYFYGLNITYFALIFLFNNGILLTVTVRICQMSRIGLKGKKGRTVPWKQVCTVLGLTCLLGSTWGLAFLSYGPLSIPMQYLFCIFNSLQGFFIFLWICRTSRKAQREAVSKSS